MQTIKTLLFVGNDRAQLSPLVLATEQLINKDELQIQVVHLTDDRQVPSYVETHQTHVIFLHGIDHFDKIYDLIGKVKLRSPNSLILVQSSESKTNEIVSCMRVGAFDCFDRDASISQLALSLRRAVKFASFQNDRNQLPERWIFSSWERLQQSYANPENPTLTNDRKGKLLEDLCLALFRSIEGWERIRPNAKPGVSEEIDLVIFNDSPAPFWQARGSVILVECKNIADGAGAQDYRNFLGKVASRGPNCKLGFLVARSLRASYDELLLLHRNDDHVIAPLDYHYSLARLVYSDDRTSTLRDLVQDLLLGKPSWKTEAPQPSWYEEGP